jgi:dipeptidyl aminopeptidase/acylaminoacyl peptidase
MRLALPVRPLLLTLLAAFFPAVHAASSATAPTPITLDQAMANPDWIGTPVEAAWWGWNGQIYYKQKRLASPLRDTVQITGASARLNSGKKVEDSQLANLDGPNMVYNRAGTRAILLRNSDLFERDLKSGALTQITRGVFGISDPQYSNDGSAVQYRSGNDWFSWSRAERLSAPVALLRAVKDPDAKPDADSQRDLQLRLIVNLARQKEDRDTSRDRRQEERRADATRAPAPIYLGDKVSISGSALSPDGRWLLFVTQDKSADKGKVGKLARYVTETGYPEIDDERTRVGRNMPIAQTLHLADLRTGTVREIAFDSLPGIATDPLAALRVEQKLPALKGNRPVTVDAQRDGIAWTDDGSKVAVLVRAIDNKDRWISTVDLANGALVPAHRISDVAWVNRRADEFGWLPDNATLWYLSEETGYAHLYTKTGAAPARALTHGNWEVSNVEWSRDGKNAYFVCNPQAPGTYEVCATTAKDGGEREVTSLKGVENFGLSPDNSKLLVRYSSSYVPPQLATVPVAGGKANVLTDTRSDAFKARNWIMPQLVQVPSTHGAAPIWAKLYRPAQLEAGKQYPVVMFAHGAGYLQNVTERYPVYFREQMFHNLLVEQGFIVLDVDYRASLGYGSAWRTAIYRQMGHPELEDFVDGANWLAATQQGDIKNVGIYGGSYGGFMSLMALMRAPEVFKSGAALRPVTDWTTYNHEYTANILNTPELDPQAYKTSSPIEYADKLTGNLLIAHGMIDDNVFYQDSVRLSQRLIELKKSKWEMASYPMERHGFVQPEAWYDEYRRIDELFQRTLK